MGIWIRSQDKEKLVKSNRIEIDVQYVIEIKDNVITIGSLDNSNNWTSLGTYSTKEKALKVLDRIHLTLNGINTNGYLSIDAGHSKCYKEELQRRLEEELKKPFPELPENFIQDPLPNVFQMPQDSEVE